MFPVDHALLSDLLSHLLPLVWVDALQQLDQLHLVYCVLFPAALQLVKLFVEALTLLLSSLLLNAHNGFQEGNLADCVHVDLVEEFLEINHNQARARCLTTSFLPETICSMAR